MKAALGWLAGGLLIAAPLSAQPASEPPARAAAPMAGRQFESTGQGVFGGQRLRYKAVVAETLLTDGGKATASVFTTSYVRTDVKDPARPVIFVFNGGPGSSSIWLHLGFVGPRRIDFRDVLKPETVPPFRTVDNGDSPLDVADIVLIDPPGTGYSRILPDGKPEQFYGVAQDARMTAQVIEQWVRKNNRWNAPKYLLSESYGTVRAAAVARLLAGGPMETGNMEGMTLAGVILLGQSMDLSRGGEPGDDRPYLTALPTLAATACFHGKLGAGCSPVEQAEKARQFAAGPYLKALYAGAALPPSERRAVAATLASLTGLSPAVVEANNLRISTQTFARTHLADRGLQLGAYDARYTLALTPNGNDPVADDPAMGQYVPGFVGAFNDYVRGRLGVAIDDGYQAIAFRAVNARWDYGLGPGVPAGRNHAVDLAIAMRRNPSLRLMVGTGLYDLVTTLGAADYTIAHAGIALDRVTTHLYPSGHMPYLGDEARQQLARDLRNFLLGPQRP